MKVNIKFSWLFLVSMILVVGCSAESKSVKSHIPLPTPDYLKGEGQAFPITPMSRPALEHHYRGALALAEDRDKWFLASDITKEVVEGLYDSWSVICRKETNLSEYEEAVYRFIRPLILGSLEMKLEDVQNADRYYELDSLWGPWVYVKQTWKVDDKVIFGPHYQLYITESVLDMKGSAWRYHDC